MPSNVVMSTDRGMISTKRIYFLRWRHELTAAQLLHVQRGEIGQRQHPRRDVGPETHGAVLRARGALGQRRDVQASNLVLHVGQAVRQNTELFEIFRAQEKVSFFSKWRLAWFAWVPFRWFPGSKVQIPRRRQLAKSCSWRRKYSAQTAVSTRPPAPSFPAKKRK